MRWLALAFLAALAVPLCECFFGLALARGSCAPLALLPWLVLAPLPRRACAHEPLGHALVRVTSFLLPPLALAVGLDLARGAPPGPLALAGGASLLACLTWTSAAEFAARRPALARFYAGLWFVALPASAALFGALSFAPRRATLPAPPAWCGANPLLACLAAGRSGALEELDLGVLAAPVLGALLALLLLLARARAVHEDRA